MALLAAGCAQLGIALQPQQLAQFELYYRELVDWNERLNLTAITGYEDVQVKHFLDSLVSLPLIAAELGQGARRGESRCGLSTSAVAPVSPACRSRLSRPSWTSR